MDLGLRGTDIWGNNYDSTPNIGAFQGGGSGGCSPDWVYSEWACNVCVNSKQDCNRTRTDANGCSGEIIERKTVSCETGDFISQSGWSLHYVDSIEDADGHYYPAEQAFDGDPDTMWHTEWRPNMPSHPHEIQIDLGARYDISGFAYLPRIPDGNGKIKDYGFYVSDDTSDWRNPAAEGSFDSTTAEKKVMFSPVSGRYVRLVAFSEVNGGPLTAVAELNMIGSPATCIGFAELLDSINRWKSNELTMTGLLETVRQWKLGC